MYDRNSICCTIAAELARLDIKSTEEASLRGAKFFLLNIDSAVHHQTY